MQYFSCCSDKYTEIKMCDLEPFSKIQSHIVIAIASYIANIRSYIVRSYAQWYIANVKFNMLKL